MWLRGGAVIKISFFLLPVIIGCSADDLSETATGDEKLPAFKSTVDSAVYNIGIPIYTSSQGKEFWTEFNSEIRPYRTASTQITFRRKHQKTNPYLECLGGGGPGKFGVRVALFKTLFDQQPLPAQISKRVNGLRFNAFGYGGSLLNVQVFDFAGNALAEKEFSLHEMQITTFSIDFESARAKEVIFSVELNASNDSITFGIDDIYLKTNDTQAFYPPSSDNEFLAWLKRSSFHFFDWNYIDIASNKGVVVESTAATKDIVSLSGIGYAYPIFMIGELEGYLTAEESKRRVKSMLQWQVDQNWFDGSAGWHGFPNHYFKADGSYYQSDVSTIDWAICAAGIRTVRSYYKDDVEIVAMANELLARPDWTKSLAADKKIAMGFDARSGIMNSYRWGLAFSEETELVYLESVASGDLPPSIFEGIIRDKKSGFYPSWFAAGFTYNWLQLWTGPIEPYKTNSITAYDIEAATCLSSFDRPLLGLTACATVKEFRESGFNNWGRYISNQGGSVHGARAGEVIQISPAPYGAALALPFQPRNAMNALREFVKMGYYHEYLGLPDNVRLKELPSGATHAANWDSFDINIGPIVLAVEQVQGNRIADLYLSDDEIAHAVRQLQESFP